MLLKTYVTERPEVVRTVAVVRMDSDKSIVAGLNLTAGSSTAVAYDIAVGWDAAGSQSIVVG